ncbi:MAG: hypothetical protein ACLUVF_03565 [Adlercreutzia sp.]
MENHPRSPRPPLVRPGRRAQQAGHRLLRACLDCGGDPDSNVHVWPAVEDGGAHVCVCPVSSGEHDLAVYSVDVDKIGDGPITVRDLDSIGTREVHVDDFWEKPEEVRLFLRTDADVYLFGSSLGKSLTVEDRAGDDIAPALREVRTYCKDATEKRDPQIIGAMAQAAAANRPRPRAMPAARSSSTPWPPRPSER